MSVHVLESFVIGAYYRNLENRCLQRHRSITSPAGAMKISIIAPKGAWQAPRPGCQLKHGASREDDEAAPKGIVPARSEGCLLVSLELFHQKYSLWAVRTVL